MCEANRNGALIGVIIVLLIALVAAGAWIVLRPTSSLAASKVEESSAVEAQPVQTVVDRLRLENGELKAKLADLEKALAVAEQKTKDAEAKTALAERQADRAVFEPLAEQVRAGNELVEILKRLNGPLTDLQKDETKKILKGFIGDHEGRPLVFKGHVSKVAEKILSSRLILNLEVLEGVRLTFQADPNQKDVLEELNASYEVAVLGRVKQGAIGAWWLPGQHFKMAFVKPVNLEDYARASRLLQDPKK